MTSELISYREMCSREGRNLRRGMHFGIADTHSVILTSVRPNAPYDDRFENDGAVLIYEGQNEPYAAGLPPPELRDQMDFSPSGTLTQNGKFHRAAQAYKRGERPPELVRVYEKISPGVWSYNGIFHLVDSWQEAAGERSVFKFKLTAVENGDS